MLVRFLEGTIDALPFTLIHVEGCRPIWGELHQLNAEQETDVLGTIEDYIAEEREARIFALNNSPAYTPKFTTPGCCGECGRPQAPAHYVACADCHHMIDPADDASHMCIERTYRLRTAAPQYATSSSSLQ